MAKLRGVYSHPKSPNPFGFGALAWAATSDRLLLGSNLLMERPVGNIVSCSSHVPGGYFILINDFKASLTPLRL
jgi:hypothetical protein